MTTATVTDEFFTIELTKSEHVLAVHGDVQVPRSAITGVELVEDGMHAAHGLRTGLHVPGRRLLGTIWSPATGREFVAVRSGEPAVRVTLRDQPWQSVLLSSPHAADLAAQLRLAA